MNGIEIFSRIIRARVTVEGRRPMANYTELSTSSNTRIYYLMLRAVILTENPPSNLFSPYPEHINVHCRSLTTFFNN